MGKYVTDWSIYKNFTEDEFKCPCCGSIGNGISKSLVDNLQYLRNKHNKAIIITSGYRCNKYNLTLVGSSSKSLHLTGQASDWYFQDGSLKNQSDRISMMDEIRKLPYYHYTYCNINGNHPNMGEAIHTDFLFENDKFNLQRILYRSCYGIDVLTLQKRLNELKIKDNNNQKLIEDRFFGKKTHQAVLKFQKANGLKADGKVGNDTAHKLDWLFRNI